MGKIGIIGGGQLGRMLALAGYPLGLQFACLDSQPGCSGAQVMPLVQGDFADQVALKKIAERSDILTYEFENIPVESVHFLQQHRVVFPGPEVLAISQDRSVEKDTLRRLQIPIVDYVVVRSLNELKTALQKLGSPALLKTCRLGYDGKGQWKINSLQEAEKLWPSLPQTQFVLEAFCDFESEVSLIAAAGRNQDKAYYPLIQNHHEGGILRWSRFPGPDLAPALQEQAQTYAARLIRDLNYVGVLTIEFFLMQDQLVVNEIAPRVHNSGHLTIEGAECSQFENHLRAILGWPLGSTQACGHSLMVNLIGQFPNKEKLLAIPGLHYHDYGKQAREQRKLGHLSIQREEASALEEIHQQILEIMSFK